MILNCAEPQSPSAKAIAEDMQREYGVPVAPLNCLNMTEEDIKVILSDVLGRFPIKEIAIDMPGWLMSLDREHWLRKAVLEPAVAAARSIGKISEVRSLLPALEECEYVKDAALKNINLGSGRADITIMLNPQLFYKVLSEETGIDIEGESSLMPRMRELAEIKQKYDRIRGALDQVEAVGYGIVMPSIDELTLEEPEIVRQGGRYGVKLCASAPSIHMMRADITTEVAPIVGSEKQSEDLVRYLLDEFEEDPKNLGIQHFRQKPSRTGERRTAHKACAYAAGGAAETSGNHKPHNQRGLFRLNLYYIVIYPAICPAASAVGFVFLCRGFAGGGTAKPGHFSFSAKLFCFNGSCAVRGAPNA